MTDCGMDGYECAGFEFFSNFDSANIAKVEYVTASEPIITTTNGGRTVLKEVPDVEFNIWTKPDCFGTEYENGNRTWFYFGMRGFASALLVKINMVDLNRQTKMYSQGMAPVYRVLPGKPHWERIRDKPSYNNEENIFTLSFTYRTPDNYQSITYFAFTYPFSYVDLQVNLTNIDHRFSNHEFLSKDDIYYTRECVCNSLDGRRIDLITISSYYNISAEREVRLKDLFPDENVPRPFRFIGKKIIFVSARVHPGETPSSFVFNGLLNLLLNREDPTAILLRRLYVFKLIPFLNPDGVSRGHYRTDTLGVNLNRVYLNPSLTLHPSIYAARALIRYYHYGYEKEDSLKLLNFSNDVEDSSCNDDVPQNDNKLSNKVSHMSLEENENSKNQPDLNNWSNKCKDLCLSCGTKPITNNVTTNSFDETFYLHGDVNCNESGLFLYIDMHGHASKKGIFMYGNHFEGLDQNVECMLLPKLMSINNHNFHFSACNFTEKNMYTRDRRDGMSREGSGRVAVLKLTGLIKSYTLECNYNTGRIVNVLPSTIKESNSRVHILPVPPKYSPLLFEEVGKALGSSILDLTGQNPNTRLPNSEFRSVNGLREWLRIHCANELGETRTTPAKLKIKNSVSLHNQGKSFRAVMIKSRSAKSSRKMTAKVTRSSSVSVKKIENYTSLNNANNSQPHSSSSSSLDTLSKTGSSSKTKPYSACSKIKNDSVKYKNANCGDKQNVSSRYMKYNTYTSYAGRQKLKADLSSKLQTFKEKKNKSTNNLNAISSSGVIKLHDICFIKNGCNKKLIATFQKPDESADSNENNLIIAWNTESRKPRVFSGKEKIEHNLGEYSNRTVTNKKSLNKQTAIHGSFMRHSHFSKNKKCKKLVGKIDSALPKVDKLKKYKKVKNKVL